MVTQEYAMAWIYIIFFLVSGTIFFMKSKETITSNSFTNVFKDFGIGVLGFFVSFVMISIFFFIGTLARGHGYMGVLGNILDFFILLLWIGNLWGSFLVFSWSLGILFSSFFTLPVLCCFRIFADPDADAPPV